MAPEDEAREVTSRDEVLRALDDVVDAAHASAAETHEIIERAHHIRHLRGRHDTWRSTLEEEDRPRMVEQLTIVLNRLSMASGRLRRAQAHALRNEGMSIEQVAALFGVSRQRVSMLLRSKPDDSDAASG